MNFRYEEPLKEYMRKKDISDIFIEVYMCHSWAGITEIYARFANKKKTEFLKSKKHYRSIPTEMGEILLPPIKLEYANPVVLGLQSSIFGKLITLQGVKI